MVPKSSDGTNVLILGAELQILHGFKVDVINIECDLPAHFPECRFGHLQPYVYSIE